MKACDDNKSNCYYSWPNAIPQLGALFHVLQVWLEAACGKEFVDRVLRTNQEALPSWKAFQLTNFFSVVPLHSYV